MSSLSEILKCQRLSKTQFKSLNFKDFDTRQVFGIMVKDLASLERIKRQPGKFGTGTWGIIGVGAIIQSQLELTTKYINSCHNVNEGTTVHIKFNLEKRGSVVR